MFLQDGFSLVLRRTSFVKVVLVVCGMLSVVQSRSVHHHGRHAATATTHFPSNTVVLGSCWSEIEDSGKCQGLMMQNVTKAKCCREGGNHAGWTSGVLSHRQYFNSFVMGQGAEHCKACHTSCDNIWCSSDKVCKIRQGIPRCVCAPDCKQGVLGNPNLPPPSGQVCSFDGRTYNNYCDMLRANCRQNANYHMDYVGRCQYSCANVTCVEGSSCITDQNGIPHCIPCQTNCSGTTDPSLHVCGGDGRTYASVCHIERMTCLTSRAVRIAYAGPCIANLSCSDLVCPNRDTCLMNPASRTPMCVPCYRPCYRQQSRNGRLCGTDGVTYSNYCDMFDASCSEGIIITTDHYGQCLTPGDENNDYLDDEESVAEF